MLKRFEADKSPDVPIIDCSGFMINKRAKDQIDQLKTDDESRIILISAVADATKDSTMGEYFQRNQVRVGGTYPNRCVNEIDYNPNYFIQT